MTDDPIDPFESTAEMAVFLRAVPRQKSVEECTALTSKHDLDDLTASERLDGEGVHA